MKKTSVLPILFATLLIDMIGIGMVIPIIPILFTDPSSPSFLLSGYTVSQQYFIAGLVTSLFGIMQFLAAPILGELSDVYGHKRLLTLGVGVLAVSQIIFGFGIEVASLGLILFSRAIAGLAGANFSIVQAAIADVSEPQDRAKNFGLVGAAFGIGFILGPVLGGWVATFAQNPAAPFWLAGMLGILNLIFITLMLPETHRVPTSFKHHFTFLKGFQNIKAAFADVDARPMYLTSFLYVAGFSFAVSFMGVMLVERFSFSEAQIGTFFGVAGAWIAVTQLFILRIISSRYAERSILRYSIPAMACATCALPFAPDPFVLYAFVPLFAIPQGLSMANIQALISKGISAQKQGAAMGINSSLSAFSQGIIPLVAGVGSGVIGVEAPFVAGALLMLASWSILFGAARRP